VLSSQQAQGYGCTDGRRRGLLTSTMSPGFINTCNMQKRLSAVHAEDYDGSLQAPCSARALRLYVLCPKQEARLALVSLPLWPNTSSGQGSPTSWSTLMMADTWCVSGLSAWSCTAT
jgi:hypothetical protein